jgi:hypothetical protein
MIDRRSLLLLASLLGFGCGGGGTVLSPTHTLSGIYAGSYLGTTNGTLEMKVSASLEVSATANVAGHDYTGDGTLAEDGTLSFGIGIAQGIVATFEGKFIEQGAGVSGSGTWASSDGGAGTWSLTRD